MPLLIRPVKMNKSIYVRVPNDIAHIIGLDNQVEVSFNFEDMGNELRLIYSLDKSKTQHQQPDNGPTVNAASVNRSKPSSQASRNQERREGNGTQIQSEELPRQE